MTEDTIWIVCYVIMIAWGLALIFFARTIHTHGPFRNMVKPGEWATRPSSMIVRRAFGAFWLVVGVWMLARHI